MPTTIVVTGAAGFIGSHIVEAFDQRNDCRVIAVDHIGHAPSDAIKRQNLAALRFEQYVERDLFLPALAAGYIRPDAIIHFGAITDTQETNEELLLENNTRYSQRLFAYCREQDRRFLYASSAATYGDGSRGWRERMLDLAPLNPYAHSKHLLDRWVIEQEKKPPQWVGLKCFNVYGPREAHKGAMASMVWQGYRQILANGELKLFKSYSPDVKDGEQKRDFVYVKDVVNVVLFFLEHPEASGIFNVGTGKARSFLDLGHALFGALGRKPQIRFVDMPERLRKRYQYFTEADITALQRVGYRAPLCSLEEGVADYLRYLQTTEA